MNVAWVLFGLAACYASGVTADGDVVKNNQRPFVVYRGGGYGGYDHGGHDGYGDYQRQWPLLELRGGYGSYGHGVYGQGYYGLGDRYGVYRSGRQFPELWRAMPKVFGNQPVYPIYIPGYEHGYFPGYQPGFGY